MKRLVTKCIGYALIFGFTMPALGYKWTVYNGLPEWAMVQLNVSAQVSQHMIAPGGNFLFDYSDTWRWGLCLTTIYAQPTNSSQLEATNIGQIIEEEFNKIINNLNKLVTAMATPNAPGSKKWIALLVNFFDNIVKLLHDLCSTGSWIITQNPRTGEMYSVRKALAT